LTLFKYELIFVFLTFLAIDAVEDAVPLLLAIKPRANKAVTEHPVVDAAAVWKIVGKTAATKP
jgi:hypothetical protein